MISMKEILMNRAKFEELPEEIQKNLTILHERINIVRKAYGKPLKVNDGLRLAHHKPKNGSATSWHYKGAAIDLDDNDAGDFAKWCIANLELIANAGLYLEDFRWTNGCGSWVHFQIFKSRSGKRVFVPSTAPACNPNIWDGKYDSKLDG